MLGDKLEKSGPLMNAIGVEGAVIVGGNPDGLFIYAEPDGGSVFLSVFRNEGDVVRYYPPTSELFDLIRAAWENESPDENMRWAVIEYEVSGTSFHVELRYPEELKSDEDASDRREAALKRRYGDKPIVYPPIPDDLLELKRD